MRATGKMYVNVCKYNRLYVKLGLMDLIPRLLVDIEYSKLQLAIPLNEKKIVRKLPMTLLRQ